MIILDVNDKNKIERTLNTKFNTFEDIQRFVQTSTKVFVSADDKLLNNLMLSESFEDCVKSIYIDNSHNAVQTAKQLSYIFGYSFKTALDKLKSVLPNKINIVFRKN